MKKVSIAIILTLMMTSVAFAQYEPKGKISKAESALNSGDLDEAKAEVDLAFEVNKKGKVKDDSKSWYVRGDVYKAIFLDDSTEFQNLSDNALDIATESYRKAMEMEKETSPFYQFSMTAMNQLYGAVMNEGAAFYNEGKYAEAYDKFRLGLEVFPDDTTAYLYAGTSAQQAEMYEESLKMYEGLIETGNADADVYKAVIYLYKTQFENIDKVVEYCNKGVEKFPEDEAFVQEKITTLIVAERADEAEKELKAAIENDPDNAVLYYQLGYLYDQQEEADKAFEAYKNAIDVDPDYFEANFNAGVIYYNKAADILKELNNMSIKEYNKNETAYMEKAKVEFEKALPYLEKAYELQPDDIQIMETLEGLYIRLKMNEKAEELDKKIKEIRGE